MAETLQAFYLMCSNDCDHIEEIFKDVLNAFSNCSSYE